MSEFSTVGSDRQNGFPAENLHRVMYVEDNPANLKLVDMILQRRGDIRLLPACSAEIGLALLRNQQADLILMDIHLPGMDGYEMLKQLQLDEQTRNIPVVAVSANALPQDVEKGLEAGFIDYLTKPIRVSDLLRILDRLLLSQSPQS